MTHLSLARNVQASTVRSGKINQTHLKKFIDLGYGDELYKLTLITDQRKQALMSTIDFMPGHRAKMNEVFRKIETVSIHAF
jgi:hypothetical protein